MEELECLVPKENLDAVVILKTCWDRNNPWDTLNLPYKLYWKERERRVEGGLAL